MQIFFRLLAFASVLLSGSLRAQTFTKTLEKIDLAAHKESQFHPLRPAFFTDSLLKKQYIGIKVGANLSNFSGDASNTGNLVGLRASLCYGRRISRKITLETELAYSKQGAKQTGKLLKTGILLDSGQTFATKQNYLALPILLKYYPLKKAGLFLETGVRAAFLLNAQLQGRGGTYAKTAKDRIRIEKALKPFDFGILLGIGFSFYKNTEICFRYNPNFINYLNHKSLQAQKTGVYHNRLFQIALQLYAPF